MFLGEFARLNSYFQSFGFLFNQTASAEEGLSGGVDGLLGPGIAFFGGVVSFLSRAYCRWCRSTWRTSLARR